MTSQGTLYSFSISFANMVLLKHHYDLDDVRIAISNVNYVLYIFNKTIQEGGCVLVSYTVVVYNCLLVKS